MRNAYIISVAKPEEKRTLRSPRRRREDNIKMGHKEMTAWEHHVPLAFQSGREADHSPPSSAEVKEWVELYLHSPTTPSWRGAKLGGVQKQGVD
jgi:hypothetical protein